MRQALVGVDSLFLLVSNAPDELTQAINTLGLARAASVKGVAYLSVTRSAQFTDVAHFAFEHNLTAFAPAWKAWDMRAMMARYQADGAVATESDIGRLTALLGRPPRTYRAFAEDTARQWQ